MDVVHLFAYGTLLPGEPRWTFLEPFVEDQGRADHAVGVLYDTGQGYPAARFGAEGRISGRVFTLRPQRIDEALIVLDEVEGAVAGLYRRVSIVTGAGIAAHAYEYGGGLQLRPIASGSWLARD